MTTISERSIPTSSADLPPVERRPAIPAGFKAGGLAAGIKASGRPDLAVVIDSPAFNWRVARQMKKRGIPVVYYVCPQFWAWRQGRVRLLRMYSPCESRESCCRT